MSKLYIILFLFLININVFSQKKINSKSDTTYIKNISNKLSVRIYNIWKKSDLILTDIETKKSLIIKPNGSTNIGLGFNYKWMGLGIAIGMPFINNDDSIYGKTNRFDFQLNLYGRSLGADIYYQRYKGFYISNPNQFVEWPSKKYPILSDMVLFAAGASVYYFFNNKKFSYRAAFVRNEIQKKGQGSIILGAYYSVNTAYDKTGFVSDVLPDSVKKDFNINAFTSHGYGISFGYTFTFVIKKFFINLSLVPGLGIVKSKIYTTDEVYNLKNKIATRYIIRFALGYEHKNFYLGATAYTTGSNYEYDFIKIQSQTGNIKIFFGKRFGS